VELMDVWLRVKGEDVIDGGSPGEEEYGEVKESGWNGSEQWLGSG